MLRWEQGELDRASRPRPSRAAPPRDDAPAGPWARRFGPGVAVVGALALAVRALTIWWLPHRATWGLPNADGFYYYVSSQTLRSTGVFGTTDANGVATADVLHPPLWVSYLAGARLLGAGSADQLRCAAAALGIAAAVLVTFAGRRICSPRAGLVAGALVAITPGLWTYERNLNAEAITAPLIAAVILLAYRYLDRPRLGRYLAVAAALALLALARSEQLLVAAVLLPALALGARSVDVAHRVGRLALAGVVLVVLLTPWTVYNLGRFEHPVLLSAGSGNAMLAGACDATFQGPNLGGFDPRCALLVAFQNDTDRTVMDVHERDAALQYSRDHADRLLVVVAAREARAWGVHPLGPQIEYHAAAIDVDEAVVWAQTVLLWCLVPFAVAGTLLLRRKGVRIYPLIVFPAVAVATVALTFGDIRYRSTAEVSLALLAASGIDLVARRRAPNRDDPRER